MDWLYALGGISAVVVIAVLLGWTEKAKHLSSATKAVIWIASILALLAVRIGWQGSLLALAMVASALTALPGWVWLILAMSVGFYFISLRIAYSTIAIAQEIEQTKARIELLESSIRYKLDDISSQLPQRDEPDYIKELRKEAFRD